MRVMFLEIAQVTEAAMRGIVGELAAELVAGEVPAQPTLLGEFLQVKVPSSVANCAYLIASQSYTEEERMGCLFVSTICGSCGLDRRRF